LQTKGIHLSLQRHFVASNAPAKLDLASAESLAKAMAQCAPVRWARRPTSRMATPVDRRRIIAGINAAQILAELGEEPHALRIGTQPRPARLSFQGMQSSELIERHCRRKEIKCFAGDDWGET
jgi:hypothetical protein